MMNLAPALDVLKKPVVLVGAALLLAVLLIWLFVFFVPQSHKLSTLQSQKSSLQQTVVRDDARLRQVREESHHVGQIAALHTKLEGYVPAQEDLYTYIQTISSAAKGAGVTISSLQPGALEPAAGTTYSAIPIVASIKGTYDQLLAFVKAVYGLPRLTDINSINITGGGQGTSRSTALTATVDLAIFTSQKEPKS